MPIKMITTNYALKNGTKASWLVREQELSEITDNQYNNIIKTAQGGLSTLTKGYTSQGPKIVKLVSKNPNRMLKTIRDFYFD